MSIGENAGTTLAPRDVAELAEIVRTHPRPLEPVGGGSKRNVGRIVEADPLSLDAFAGVVEYEPAELVLVARAATPLAQIETLLSAHGQRLAFEPPSLGQLLGTERGATLGGVIATNLAGSRRVTAGAARDHFLGFSAVSGRGEIFKAGAKVVKNVTGYDLPKLLAGSWGTLAVLTDVTVRVAPAPETETTVIVQCGGPDEAVATMSRALGSPFEVSAAAYDPELGVALRLEGFESSVASRTAGLVAAIGGAVDRLDGERSRALWRRIGAGEPLAEWSVVWRISVPPTDAPRVLARIEPERYLLDWGGGLILAGFRELDAGRVRGAITSGHATVLKAPDEDRRGPTPLFHLPPSLAGVTARIKHAFDPLGKLNPRRMS